MPLPQKQPNESTAEFVSRAMGVPVMKREYPKRAQRLAVAYSIARHAGKRRQRRKRAHKK